MPAIQADGLGLLPYSPLGSGLLSGKYKRNAPLPPGAKLTKIERLAEKFLTESNWSLAEKLGDFAASRGPSLLDVAFSWLLANPSVASVIAGATTPEQIAQNVGAGACKLDPEEISQLNAMTA